MQRLTLGDMFSRLFDYLGKNPLFIIIFVIFILVYFYLILSPVFTKKHKIIYTIFFVVGVIGLIIIYGSEFWKFFDYLVDNIFLQIFFPHLTTYMIMVITTIIIFIITMLSEKISSFIKKINTFNFLLIMFFLILSLNIAVTKNVNIYSEQAVYSNEHLLAMIQMTMIIFTFWLIILGIIRIINVLSKENSEQVIMNSEPVNEVPQDNIEETANESTNNVEYTTKQEFAPIVETPIHPYIEKNNNISVINDESIVKNNPLNTNNESNSTNNEFTSNEYKLLQQYLEDIKNENNNENTK